MAKLPCVLLPVAVVVAFASAGAAAFGVWRAHERATKPSRTLKVDYGCDPKIYDGLARGIRGSHVRFVGHDRLAVAQQFYEESHGLDYHCQVWSIERGSVDRTLLEFPSSFDFSCERALSWVAWNQPYEVVDIVSGRTRPLANVPVETCALSPKGDTVAVLASFTSLELRSTLDGKLLRALAVPAPASDAGGCDADILFSPRSERIAVEQRYTGLILECDLASGSWHEVGVGFPEVFTRSGVIFRPYERNTFEPLRLVRRDGSRREFPSCVALSPSGELVATAAALPGPDRFEVVIQRIEEGDVLRRIPMSHGHKLKHVAISPDDERVALAYEDGAVEIWELP